jgi:hypothetical protein
MRCTLAVLVIACHGTTGSARAPVPVPVPANAAPAAACPAGPVFMPQVTYELAQRIAQLRIVRADVLPSAAAGSRCVDLQLELLESFRAPGTEHLHDRLRVTIAQATATAYTDRPAGAWWVGEQDLGVGKDLLAFCPDAGALAGQLQERCTVAMSSPALVGDLAFDRAADTQQMDASTTVAQARARCADASYLLGHIIWRRVAQKAGSDLGTFEEVARLLVEPPCAEDARATLFDHLYSAVTTTEDLPRTRVLVRAMFRMLAMPEAAKLHDAIVAPYLPNAIGLNGGLPARRASELLDKDARAVGGTALAGYRGPSDAAPLRGWLQGK